MPLYISSATEDDLPAICNVQYLAFTDPFSLALHPRTSYASHVEAYSNHLRHAMQQPSQYIYKVVDDSDGKIISFAQWSVACLNEEKAREEVEKTDREGEQANKGSEQAAEQPEILAENACDEKSVASPPPNKAVNVDFGNAFKQKIMEIQKKHVGDRKTLCASIPPKAVWF